MATDTQIVKIRWSDPVRRRTLPPPCVDLIEKIDEPADRKEARRAHAALGLDRASGDADSC
jgi:hypothetical protein